MGVLVLGPGSLVSCILGSGLVYESIYRINSLCTSSRMAHRQKQPPKLAQESVAQKKNGAPKGEGLVNDRRDFEVIFRSYFHVFPRALVAQFICSRVLEQQRIKTIRQTWGWELKRKLCSFFFYRLRVLKKTEIRQHSKRAMASGFSKFFFGRIATAGRAG